MPSTKTSYEHLAERIDRLESIEAIHCLIGDYNRAVDRKDRELFVEIFTADGRWELAGEVATGTDELLRLAQDVWDGLPESHHYTCNIKTVIDGDSATSVSDVHVSGTDTKGRAVLIAASYDDQLVRAEGRWRFAGRAVVIHFRAPITEPWTLDPATRFNV
jgi:uncharacterized protein (TIGR02246 family)